jgi:hypothetical protein
MSDAMVLAARPKTLLEQRLIRPMQKWNTWDIDLPAEHGAEDILRPEYWAHVARKLRDGDRLYGLGEDGRLDIELRVAEVRAYSVHMRVLRATLDGRDVTALCQSDAPLPARDPAEKVPRVEYTRGAHRHRVIGLDGSVVAHGFATDSAAREEMARLYPGRKAA